MRAVRLAIKKNGYITKTETAKGGKRYLIKLGSLEPELQSNYIQEYYQDIVLTGEIIELQNMQLKQEKLIPERQKKIALAKIDLIRFRDKFRTTYKPAHYFQTDVNFNDSRNSVRPFSTARSSPRKEGKLKADKEFLQLYNTGELYPSIYSELGKISIGSLYRWKCLAGFNNDWTAQASNYSYCANREYRTSLSDDEIKIFLKILLSPNQFSIGKAVSVTKHILTQRGFEILPKDVTFRRYANWFKKANYDKWILAREGMKSLKDKVEAFIVRNASLLETGQVLVADGKTLNFQVINPFTGKPTRATLLGFLDWHSGGLVGYEIMLEECIQSIALALRNAILTMGKVPSYVYQDNGRAFKNKFFNGDKTLKN